MSARVASLGLVVSQRRRFVLLAFVACAIAAGAVSTAEARSSKGVVVLSVAAPRGVPATVVLAGRQRLIVAKGPSATVRKARLSVAAGSYAVVLSPSIVRGRLYAATTAGRRIRVLGKRTVRLRIRYTSVPSARNFRATHVTSSTVSLSWSAPKRARVVVRRSSGTVAPSTRNRGAAVRTSGHSAVDQRLVAGRHYAYSLFTKVGRRWVGPLTIAAGTSPPAGSKSAAYVAAPTTLLPVASGIARETVTAGHVRLRLKPNTAVPSIGSIVVLPASGSLPGGYVGRVTRISANGDITLVAAGLADAFDYYNVNVPNFSSTAQTLRPLRSSQRSRLGSAGRRVEKGLPEGCDGSSSDSLTLSPSFGLGGHFSAAIDKFGIFGHGIPKGAHFDMALTATAKGAVTAQTKAALHCGIPFKPVIRVLTADPVPISIYFTPVAELSVEGSVEVANLGVQATAGFQLQGSFGFSGASFSGQPILSATPLTPEVKATGSVNAKLGGQVIVGPGAGTPDAGVIAGVGGELNPIDSHFSAAYPVNDSRHNACFEASAAFTRELNFTAKAWLGDWDISKSVTVDALKGETPYPGSPWHLPSGCDKPPATPDTPPATPGDSVIGPGVDKQNDSTGGSWGRVDGFVPGQKTWVLSTGNIMDVVGSPDSFASTNRGDPGDAALSTFGGYPTSDASYYDVTLVPHSSHLHVKYAFGSEEYPEYVGSQFNDVMGVFVNGQNCATVPDGTDPVSVNTINGQTNSQYYVDNSTGAPGYNTTMDGLTVPLQCNVIVTPGQPVTVRIAVADSSDGIYDSAVALLDQGIWAD